jgi:hypothetical protein
MKQQRYLSQDTRVTEEVRTQHLPNTSLEALPLRNLLDLLTSFHGNTVCEANIFYENSNNKSFSGMLDYWVMG